MLIALADASGRSTVLIVAATSGSGRGTTATAILSAIIAGIVVAAVVGTWNLVAHRARRSRDRETAAKIANLEALVRRLKDEADSQLPKPTVSLVTRSGLAAAKIEIVRATLPLVDVDAVVASESRAALATLPPVERSPEAKDRDKRLDELASKQGLSPALLKGFLGPDAARPWAGFGGRGPRLLPVSEDDHATFHKLVNEYEAKLRRFIPAWIEFADRFRELVIMKALIENVGGSPADGASIRLHFPDPWIRGQVPKRPPTPTRPKFEQRENPGYTSMQRLLGLDSSLSRALTAPGLRMPTFNPPNINFNGPFYDDGSVTVRFEYKSVQHHDPLESELFTLAIPQAGTYEADWIVHAKNLPQPVRGVFTVNVMDESPSAEPVCTLQGLLALVRGDEEDS
jgi:hypothetical protein